MDEMVVPETDEYVGFSCHACVNCFAGQLFAEQAVGGIGRDAADVVAGIEILDAGWHLLGIEVFGDLLFKKRANVAQAPVTRGIELLALGLKQMLPGSFGDDNDRMLSGFDSAAE